MCSKTLAWYRCRDHFFPAVKIVPPMSRTVMSAVDFVINEERSLRGSYISAVYIHIHIHAYLCADQPLKSKRHFFRCAANKEIIIIAPGYSQSCDLHPQTPTDDTDR